MMSTHRTLIALCCAALWHCGGAQIEDLGDGEEIFVPEDGTTFVATSNPAPFDLNCLWAGDAFAKRAPNAVAAAAIRHACDIQAARVPYRVPGGNPWRDRAPSTTEGVDCSGLTANIYYRASGHRIQLPHSAAAQEKMLPAVNLGQILPGDLLYYQSSSALSGRHVTMYLGDNKMIEAGGSNVGVIVGPVRTQRLTSVRRPS